MNVAIIYSKKLKTRRRVIKLDHEGAHTDHFKPHKDVLHRGEGWIEIAKELYESFKDNELDAYLAKKIGKPKSDRCVVICPAEGVVKHVIRADPAIDFHHAGDVVLHKTAVVGDEA